MDWQFKETSVVILGAGFSVATTEGKLPLSELSSINSRPRNSRSFMTSSNGKPETRRRRMSKPSCWPLTRSAHRPLGF
jgi:hypothetical protein